MQWTPYEVKRLEYQLRVDAANRCPGTELVETEPLESEPEREPDLGRLTLLQRVSAAITSLLSGRARARAS